MLYTIESGSHKINDVFTGNYTVEVFDNLDKAIKAFDNYIKTCKMKQNR